MQRIIHKANKTDIIEPQSLKYLRPPHRKKNRLKNNFVLTQSDNARLGFFIPFFIYFSGAYSPDSVGCRSPPVNLIFFKFQIDRRYKNGWVSSQTQEGQV